MKSVRIWVAFLGILGVCGVSFAADDEGLAVAGRLPIDIHSELMVANGETDRALNWFNSGSLWGCFGDFGFDGPKEQYPKLVVVDDMKEVAFEGTNFLRLDTKPDDTMTSDGDFSIEVWVKDSDPKDNECLLSWTNGDGKPGYVLSYSVAGGKMPKDDKWHHLVVLYSKGEQTIYVDGAEVAKKTQPTELTPGGTFVLGADCELKNNPTGSIAAVRIHKDVMTADQIARNFAGGVLFGTELFDNIDPNTNEPTFADPNKPGLEVRRSKHFRVCWMKEKDEKNVMDQRVPKQLADAEYFYDQYTHRLGMHPPITSAEVDRRGYGKKYKIEICTNWDGGNFGGYNRGYGYPIQGAGDISAHELMHATQMNQMGCFPGNWWEAHANWGPEQISKGDGGGASVSMSNSPIFAGNGRHYYHCFLIFNHLAQTPEYGHLFIARMWHKFKRAPNGDPRYHWKLFEEIDPDPSTPIADEWIKMARRNVTWDYTLHDTYVKATDNPDTYRYGRVLLEPIPAEKDWYRVPREMAPQQFGFNICPLEATAKTVTVDFQGLVNPERGSDWRACMVAVTADGKPRYGTIWNKGKNTIKVEQTDKGLYLVVVATPTDIVDVPMTGDYRSMPQHQFPYRVKLKGAKPLDVLIPSPPKAPGKRHPNGGGFVADTAKIDATAYVSRDAQVLGASEVRGNVRIEDYAVVENSLIRDNAYISGHARVEAGEVGGFAKVSDYARVTGGAVVKDYARILEHGTAGGSVFSGYAVVKGMAAAFGKTSGTAMTDGSYAKANEMTKGIWLTWSWGQGHNPGELDADLGGIYAEYKFETPHPYLAWDTYGVTHGILEGNPKIVRDETRLDWVDTADVVDTLDSFESPKNYGNFYVANMIGYLYPPTTGEYSFGITSDERAELWLSEDGSREKLKRICSSDGKEPTKISLTADKMYRIEALHKEDEGDDSLSVEWAYPGQERTIIAGKYLSTAPEGPRGAIRRRIWQNMREGSIDNFYTDPKLGPDPKQAPIQALKLNGKDQYVDLETDVAGSRDVSIVACIKRENGKRNQRLFEFAADENQCMYFTVGGSDGKPAFVIKKDGVEQVLKGDRDIPVGKWTEIGLMLSDDTGMLYIDGQLAAKKDKMTLNPDDIKAEVCYLGRGLDGNYFSGLIDGFAVYSLSLTDQSAPIPNPPEWLLEPAMVSDTGAVMQAVEGCDSSQQIEYFFEETTGNPGGTSSGWQSSPTYMDTGLDPKSKYAYRCKMRDKNGNETQPSTTKEAAWTPSWAFVSVPSGDKGTTAVMEAEHYYQNVPGKHHKWVLIEVAEGYCGEGAMYASPERGPGISNYLTQAPRLDYRVKIDQPGKYHVWIRGMGRYYYSNGVYVALDNMGARTFDVGWQGPKYRWISTDKAKPFEVASAGIHTLSLWMEKDATSIDRILITNISPDDYQPTDEMDVDKSLVGKGPDETGVVDGERSGSYSELRGEKGVVRPAQWSSLTPVVVGGTRAVMQAFRSGTLKGDVEYLFEEVTGNPGGIDGNWQKEARYENAGLEAGRTYIYRVKARDSSGAETDWSESIEVKPESGSAFQEDDNGLAVMEAEHCSRKTKGPSGHEWVLDQTKEGYSGDGSMGAEKMDGIEFIATYPSWKARMDYDVNFRKTGPHWVWVRGTGVHWLHDSVRVGLDLEEEPWGSDVGLWWTQYRWVRTDRFTVETPGIHTVNVWMQEDGAVVDKVITTSDPDYVPSKELNADGVPGGLGPEESTKK